MNTELLLILTVAAVGVLHTMVPDHWAPIALVARQQGWSRGETARAALGAGSGHVVSTLLIGLVVWVAGVAAAARFGHAVSVASSVALVAFGAWIAVTAWREIPPAEDHTHDHANGHNHDREHGHGHDHPLVRHVHAHVHVGGPVHAHVHGHGPETWHRATAVEVAAAPVHEHTHETSRRTALLLILGSSPMVEGIPAFFAAARYGPGLVLAMSAVFAVSTIATYVLLCTYATAGLQRVWLGPLERYGEVLSGALVALVGLAFLIWPVL
jgi:hypothetical protein